MVGSSRSLFGYGALDDSPRAESTLAVIRVVLAGVSLVAIYLDPAKPKLYAPFAYGLLAAYVVYGVALLTMLQVRERVSESAGLFIHGGDVLVALLMTLFTEGPASPFFMFFGFALLAAGYRWGLRETVLTGVVSALLLGSEAVLVSSPHWPGGLIEGPFELKRFIIRCTYVVLLAVMVGYLAEKEKATRERLATLASDAERARVARELHDGVIQSLLGLRLQLEAIGWCEPRGSAVRVELARIDALLDSEVVNLRTMMFERTPIDERSGELALMLRDLIERFERGSGISTRFVSSLDENLASPQTCHEMWRIVQEALVNIHKHSGARHALVNLSLHEGQWRLVIEDDGKGFDFAGRLPGEALDRARKGPRVIKERVRVLGGSLIVDSTPGVRARLEITLPVDVNTRPREARRVVVRQATRTGR
jgi:signal transduction histidine kinase